MQGSQDIAVHVGTLHLTAKAVIEAFGDDIHEGDLFAINDPYSGGTHFNDVRIIRPIFHDGELIAFSQSNGHWADVGGSVPGSFDVSAKEHFAEGIRIPAVRIADKGTMRDDVVELIVSNTRVPSDAKGDLRAQAEATRVAEREILRLCEKYGGDTVVTAFEEVQDYVERLTRKRIGELPDGVWETEDYIDFDPAEGEGLVPVKVKLEIDGEQLRYDLSGSHPAVATFLNSGFGTTFSGIVGGTKTFFPDVPLNSGFYRVIDVDAGEENTVINAAWPVAVTGFCSGGYEKVTNARLRAVVAGHARPGDGVLLQPRVPAGRRARRAHRRSPGVHVVRLDGRRLGRAQRQGRRELHLPRLRRRPRGAAARGPGAPDAGADHRAPDRPRLRRPRALPRRRRRVQGRPADRAGGRGHVLLLRPRALDHLGHRGRAALDPARGLADARGRGRGEVPRRDVLQRRRRPGRRVHAALGGRRRLRRPAGARPRGGGRGRRRRLRHGRARVHRLRRRRRTRSTPSWRSTSSTRTRPSKERERIRGERAGWLEEDPEQVAERYREGELDTMDAIRRHGVILDWGTGELLERTTEQFRAMLKRRAVDHWDG